MNSAIAPSAPIRRVAGATSKAPTPASATPDATTEDPLAGDVPTVADDVVGIEWPLRVLYRRLSDRTFVAVSGAAGGPVVEYPGTTVVRPHARLVDARRPGEGVIVRHVVKGDRQGQGEGDGAARGKICDPQVEERHPHTQLPPDETRPCQQRDRGQDVDLQSLIGVRGEVDREHE